MEEKLFRDLQVADLQKGYVQDERQERYVCIFCGEKFDEGYVYSRDNRLMVAEKAAQLHVEEMHHGSFTALLNLDKQVTGLSAVQKTMLQGLHEKQTNEQLAAELKVTLSTVRTHKFNLQKTMRQAKIFLALMQLLEKQGEEAELANALRKTKLLEKIEEDGSPKKPAKGQEIKVKEEKNKFFSLNSLHPFFNQTRLK